MQRIYRYQKNKPILMLVKTNKSESIKLIKPELDIIKSEVLKWLKTAKKGDETSISVNYCSPIKSLVKKANKEAGKTKFKTKMHTDRYPSNNCMYIIAQ